MNEAIHSSLFMNKIYLELTNRCNLNCVMCYRNSWETKLGDMSRETIDHIKKSVDYNTDIIFGGIGEPTVSKQFDYAINQFKDHRLEITTNGIMTTEKLNLLCQYFKNIIISVDGTDATYYHIRKTDFKRVIDTLDYILQYKKDNNTKYPEIEFAFVLTKNNKDSIYSVIKMANKYNVKRILVSHLMPQTESQKNDIYYDEHYNPEGRKYMKNVINYAYFQNRVVVSFPYMEIKTERLCHFVENDYTYIDYQGDIIPCYRFANTYKEFVFGRKKLVKKHTFGNVNHTPLNEVYQSSTYKDFRHAVRYTLHPSCVDCEYRDGCDYIETTDYDCSGYAPSCADCLWNRKIIRCT
ncbi:MAG: radical SAM protein [Bacillota bacterium]